MATAGTPPSRMPSSARAASSACHCGKNEATRLHSAASAMEINISLRRPSPSDSAPASTMETARQAVDTDKASALCAGLTAKVCASSGKSGCTQYSKENVAKPARNKAMLTRKYSGVPGLIHTGACDGGTASAEEATESGEARFMAAGSSDRRKTALCARLCRRAGLNGWLSASELQRR